jgi:hypothetical protein
MCLNVKKVYRRRRSILPRIQWKVDCRIIPGRKEIKEPLAFTGDCLTLQGYRYTNVFSLIQEARMCTGPILNQVNEKRIQKLSS